jgi:hypothetical protein
MEMQVQDLRRNALVLYNQAFGGFREILTLLSRGDHRVETKIERRAENDRQRYNAQALASAWQGYRLK